MKRIYGWIGAAALLLACVDAVPAGHPGACGPNGCGPAGCGLLERLGLGGYRFADGGGRHQPMYGAPGPMCPTVVYPYYTTRGPRDFLSSNPRGIGP